MVPTSRIIQLGLAALGAAFMVSPAAQACTLDAWDASGSVVGAPVAGSPAVAPQVRRYSGVCGMRATGTGNYVQNDDPDSDQIFRARFYVYTSLTSGTATVYQAGNGGTPGVVDVTLSSSQISVIPVGGSAISFDVTANRWYSVEIAMNSTAAATEGNDPIAANTVIARVAGGGSDTVNSGTSAITTGSAIDFARLGCVSGCGANSVDFEEYESTRAAGTAIGRLLRGEASGDGTCNATDVTQTANNVIFQLTGGAGGFLPTGQPDCLETGNFNAGQVTCVAQRVIAQLISGSPANNPCGFPIN